MGLQPCPTSCCVSLVLGQQVNVAAEISVLFLKMGVIEIYLCFLFAHTFFVFNWFTLSKLNLFPVNWINNIEKLFAKQTKSLWVQHLLGYSTSEDSQFKLYSLSHGKVFASQNISNLFSLVSQSTPGWERSVSGCFIRTHGPVLLLFWVRVHTSVCAGRSVYFSVWFRIWKRGSAHK